jgi:multidrug efflux pump
VNVTRFAIEKNRITTVLLIVILFAGISAFRNMPRSEDPGFIIRTAVVTTYFPGASPERVEQLITDKLEKAIQEIPELDQVRSESKTGVSVVFVDIQERYTKMRPIWDDLRRKVDSAIPDLPDGIRGPFVNDDFGDVFGTILTITGEGFTYTELKDIADEVRDELLLIDEVAKVEIYGAQEERIFVEYSNARLAEFGISPRQLQQILESRNIIFPGGDVTTDRERMVLEPSGNFESLDEVRRTVIGLPGSDRIVYLEDLATIRRGYVDPPRNIMHSSGVPCLGLAINLREGGNIIRLGEKVREKVDRLRSMYPIGVEFDFVAFQPEHVDRKVKNFVRNLLQAVAIVIVVMLLTLGVRTGLVVATLIPMAMVMSFMVMSLFHIGLDQLSLASLIIALGMLVDNAIVMSESIMVQMQEGKKPVRAAIDSATELRVPLLTSSLTTAAAFLPIFLAESSTGEYTAGLFKVVTIALVSSWILAITMTPMLCVTFIKVKPAGKKGFDSRFYRAYRGLLMGLLRRPVLTLAGVLVIFIVVIQGFRFIPNIFFPPNDKAIFTAELELPVGTPIERTGEITSEIEDFMRRKLAAGPDRAEGITNWAAFIGGGAPRFVLNYNPEPSRPEYAMLVINATSKEIIDRELIPSLDDFCFRSFPDLGATIAPLALGPPPMAPVAFRISGKEQDRVFEIADRVKEKLEETPGTKNVRDNWGLRTKKLLVKVNQPRARRAGLTSLDIALSLQTILTGYQTTEFREEDKVIPVTLRSVAADRKDLGKLETHNIFVQATGRSVPLKQVADIEVVWQPAAIKRWGRLQTVTVESDLTEGANSLAITRAVDDWLKEESATWGVGYRYELGGDYESSVKANRAIQAKLPVAAFIIILLLVWQFNSIRRPFIILFTIPLSLIGVVIGLLVTGSSFGFMTMLGVISLAGIVINNAIVLLERIKLEIDENGLEPPRAVVEAAQRRLRPILLTTATTMGGLLPLWFGGGPLWESMAVAIIFGLLFATTLTLGVVPVLYSLFFRVKFKGFELEQTG